jgi:uncharacterized membrane protein YphA (DoxX/SURF4 family)
MINTILQIAGHWRQWGLLGGFGWLVALATMVIGSGLLLASLFQIYTNWKGGSATRIEQMDWLVIWGVTMVGVCLMLGLLTRSACVVGTLLLVLFVLPAWPESLQQSGQFIKNIVEGLALLTLATTRSGRWVGVDGALQFLNPWRWTAASPAPESPRGNLLPVEG